jgi:membrane protease YdiL (CAAX protease family)
MAGSKLDIQQRIDLIAIALITIVAVTISAVAAKFYCYFGTNCNDNGYLMILAALLLPAIFLSWKLRKKIDWPKGAFQPVPYRSEETKRN